MCLEEVLQEHGYHTTIAESYSRLSKAFQYLLHKRFDLVIITNTSIPPSHIPTIVPDIKARHPRGRIIVMSGHCPVDLMADLKQKGVDGFLPLPFEEDALLKEVARLLSDRAN